MFAWRGRIGFVSPTQRGKVFAYWYERAPEGVEIVPAFVGYTKSDHSTFKDGIRTSELLAESLAERGCDVISISGSPPFLLEGPEFEAEWGAGLTERLGIPVITPVLPHVQALQVLEATSVALACYYGDELVKAIVRYFNHFGIRMSPLEGFSRGGEPSSALGLYSTSLAGLDEVSAGDVYRYCKAGIRALSDEIDALYINGGGWDAAPASVYLEKDLRIPVVFALAAEMWKCYLALDVNPDVTHSGVLLQSLSRPESSIGVGGSIKLSRS